MSKQDIQQFWVNLEKTLGEKILDKTLARYIDNQTAVEIEIWGLFFSTPSHYYFKTFPKKNWFRSIINQVNEDEQKPLELAIPKETIKATKIKTPSSFWKRLISYSVPVVEIIYMKNTGQQATVKLLLEKNIIV